MKLISAAVCCIAALTGCATAPPANVVELTIYSQPPGAYITDKVTKQGFVSPVTLQYTLDGAAKDANGCLIIGGLEARWPSGAMRTTKDREVLCPPKRKFQHTFNRNPSDPGLDKDLAHANTLRQQQQAREDAASDAAAAALAGAISGWAEGRSQASQRPAPVNCVSRQVFNRVETNCY